MKKQVLMFLVGLMTMTVCYNARAGSLNDTRVSVTSSPTTLPQKPLVFLSQIGKGNDPFDIFEEGLDVENENSLSVTNEDGTLNVSLAGASWQHMDRDPSNKIEVYALEYSAGWQRHLVTVTSKQSSGLSYQILVNVDRTKKFARIWMRTKEGSSKKYSKWEHIVDYGPQELKNFRLGLKPDSRRF